MRSAILGFAVGIALLQRQAQLPGWEWHAGLLCAALLAWLIAWTMARGRRNGGLRKCLRALLLAGAGVCIGFSWAGAFAQYRLQEALPVAWEGRDITVVGTIDGLPDRMAHGVRFHFRVEHVMAVAEGAALPVLPSRLALAWYDASSYARREEDVAVAASASSMPQVRPGERWQLTVRLKRPHGNANPDGFDYEAWLLAQNLRATGSVRADAQLARKNQRLDDFVWSPVNAIAYARGWLRERILAALPGQPYAGVIVALVVGDQRAIERGDWTVFTRTGIGHLVAISGLHITMVAGLFAALAGFLWRRSWLVRAQLPLLLPVPKVRVLAGLAAACLYVLLAGCGIPAQRTLYMLLVVGVASWSGRLTPLSHVMALALALVLLLDPWAVLWPGFWLSFGAVGMILYASLGRHGNHAVAAPQVLSRAERRRLPSRWRQHGRLWWRKLRAGVYAQYSVTLGLLPLTMLLFGQYSLVSPLANAIAIPLLTLLVVPLSLLGSVLPQALALPVLQLAHDLVAWLAHWLGWLSSQPFAVWQAPLPQPWMFVVALGGTLLLLAPRGWPVRWLGWFSWLPLLLNAPTAPAAGAMQVTALDVGQGMALLLETPGHRLLYDTGPSYGSVAGADAGNRVIVPYLRARGIDHLDVVVVSHGDSDHAGGLLSLLGQIKVDRVYSSLPLQHRLVAAAPDHRRCLAGQEWRWDGVALRMLYPVPALYDSDKWNANARSCVLRVSLGKLAMLLPGDLEATQEDELVHAETLADLRANVLLAPHHGSGTSSSVPFLQAVQPELALFQMGYRNRFNHPKPEIVARYDALGIRHLRSDEAGAVTIRFDRRQWQAEAYRESHARYWYGR